MAVSTVLCGPPEFVTYTAPPEVNEMELGSVVPEPATVNTSCELIVWLLSGSMPVTVSTPVPGIWLECTKIVPTPPVTATGPLPSRLWKRSPVVGCGIVQPPDPVPTSCENWMTVVGATDTFTHDVPVTSWPLEW